MFNYFRKIKIDLSDLNLLEFDSKIETNRPYNLNFFYNKINDREKYFELKSRLPLEYRKCLTDISYCIITNPFYVFPHIDKKSINVINYYHKPGKSQTNFYECEIKNPRKCLHKGIYMDNSFDPEDIIFIDSFVAQPGDCYILDVSKIHDVIVSEGEDRHFINFSFGSRLLSI